MKEKKKAGGLTLPNLKTYRYSLGIGERKDKSVNRTEQSPEIGSQKYSHLIFGQGVKQNNGEKIFLSTNVLEQLDIHIQNKESRHRPYNQSQKLTQKESET